MFTIVKRLGADTAALEYYLMTDGEAATLGEALVMTNGRLTKCGATATPEFIAQRTQQETTSVTPLPVVRTTEEQEYETKSSSTVAPTLVGSKVTLGTDGLTVTATTTSGVFSVTATDGAATNSTVRGYFRR